MFLFKKYFAPLLFPFSVSLAMLSVGFLLLLTGKRRRMQTVLIGLALGILVVGSYGPFADACLETLEDDYASFEVTAATEQPVSWIVVLGGGVSDDPDLPPNAQLSSASQARLLEGMRLMQAYPEARLLLSGGGYFSGKSEARAMQEVVLALGIAADRIIVEEASIDTETQARHVKAYVGPAAFLLVTSAAHMARAVKLFQKQGLQPIPAPTDFQVKTSSGADYRAWYPGVDNLGKLTIFVREKLGMAWAALRGIV